MIILDTDILIDVLRKHPTALAWMDSVRPQGLALPGFVIMEVLQGCRNKPEVENVRQRLGPFAILWPSASAADAILPIYADGHLTHSLGILDALIAATALTYQIPLHTFNAKHFAAVPGLQTIQPYTR